MERTPPDEDLFFDDEPEWEEVTEETRGDEAAQARARAAGQDRRTLGADIRGLEGRLRGLSPTAQRTLFGAGAALLVVVIIVVVLVTRGGDEEVPAETSVVPTETVPAAGAEEEPPPAAAEEPTPAPAPEPAPAVPAINLPEDVTLQLDDDGDVVRLLQQALVQLGYEPGEPDGIFGEATRAAVVAFQGDQSLSADGVAGPQTLSALNSALAELP